MNSKESSLELSHTKVYQYEPTTFLSSGCSQLESCTDSNSLETTAQFCKVVVLKSRAKRRCTTRRRRPSAKMSTSWQASPLTPPGGRRRIRSSSPEVRGPCHAPSKLNKNSFFNQLIDQYRTGPCRAPRAPDPGPPGRAPSPARRRRRGRAGARQRLTPPR